MNFTRFTRLHPTNISDGELYNKRYGLKPLHIVAKRSILDVYGSRAYAINSWKIVGSVNNTNLNKNRVIKW